jgi:hypothetical protein
MKEGAVMARLLTRPGGEIMRYFNVLERNPQIRRGAAAKLALLQIALTAKLC